MSKPWNPRRETVELRASRIRREPVVRLDTAATVRSVEDEAWRAAIGFAVIAAICGAFVVGFSQFTTPGDGDAAGAAPVEQFTHCRGSGGEQTNCVVDGDTFYLNGEKLGVAGIDAPQLHPARCAEEGRLGIAAAVRLHRLLNEGKVTVTGNRLADADGRLSRTVEVNGVDIAPRMIADGVAREHQGGAREPWC